MFKLSPPARVCATAICPWNETVLYSFGNPYQPYAPGPTADLIRDANGTLYSTTEYGGASICDGFGCGTVFRVDAHGSESDLYDFQGPPADGKNGMFYSTPLLLGADGNLYGTTPKGGTGDAGTVFQLTHTDSGWTESVIHNFTGGADGNAPQQGLVEDTHGNLYGTTADGGAPDGGVVFKLTPNGGSWIESIIYTFAGPVGSGPALGRLLIDSQGNLYGTTTGGGLNGYGTVFKLAPNGSDWTESVLWNFTDGADGASPTGTLAMDPQGNLHGATQYGGGYLSNPNCTGLGAPGCGIIFKLTP